MPYIGKPQSSDPITVNASNIEDGSIIQSQEDAILFMIKNGSILGQPKDIRLTRERKIILFREMMERDVSN